MKLTSPADFSLPNQKLMGHKYLETTMIYLHVANLSKKVKSLLGPLMEAVTHYPRVAA